MRSAETILGVISERGKRGLPLEDIYRQLFNRELFLRAYGRLYRRDGALTPGTTMETVDAMSLQKIDAMINDLRYERYRWTPVRRTHIPKKSGKLRPLGIPTWSDKLLQEVIRSLLEAYYEPQMSSHSHGFRPNRGCHTALREITTRWRGVKWYIEGDIRQCFDKIDHLKLLSILAEKLHDNRFLRLISNLLRAGYLEEWTYHKTMSGVPQGGVCSPVLSNLYLDRFDQYIEKHLLPAHTDGKYRKPYPPYMALLNAARRERQAGNYRTARKLRQQAQRMPSRDPHDPNFRRLWYVRYADDWLLGFSGPRNEAEQIKAQVTEFLGDQLKLELSSEKTLITNARTESARFLGYEIVNQDADDKHHLTQHERCINGASGLKIPVDVIRDQCAKYTRHGKPIQMGARLHNSDFSIVAEYQAEYRGVVQYYLLAFNVHRLWQLHRVMEVSLVKTLADKHRTSANRIYRKYQKRIPTPHGTHQVLEVSHPRKDGQTPLVARFGGIELRRQKWTVLQELPKPIFGSRTELIHRLLAQECELCGSTESCQVHHIRKLANLNQPGQREKPLWVKRMAARQRKTLVVCQKCHEDIHRKRSSSHSKTRVTGKPR